MSPDLVDAFRKNLHRLKDLDFKVKLGSILENDAREYYITQKFTYLEEKLMEHNDQ